MLSGQKLVIEKVGLKGKKFKTLEANDKLM